MGLPAPAKLSTKPQFVRARVEAALARWWEKQERASARHGNPFSDARTKGGNVFDIQPQVSSQEAVTVLIELETELGYEPSTTVIKRGGYKSKVEFVRDLATSIGEEFLRKHR